MNLLFSQIHGACIVAGGRRIYYNSFWHNDKYTPFAIVLIANWDQQLYNLSPRPSTRTTMVADASEKHTRQRPRKIQKDFSRDNLYIIKRFFPGKEENFKKQFRKPTLVTGHRLSVILDGSLSSHWEMGSIK